MDEGYGDVQHVVWCNADRKKPVGCAGCSCPTGKELKVLRAEVARLRELLRRSLHFEIGKALRQDIDAALDAAKGGEEGCERGE